MLRLICAIGAFVLCLISTACTYTAAPTSTNAYIDGANAVVQITLDQRDVKAIRDREIYFSIVVVECADMSKRTPLRPYLDGKMIEGGNFPREVPTMVVGTMAASNLQSYEKPCVFLQGGSYYYEKLWSPMAPVVLTTSK